MLKILNGMILAILLLIPCPSSAFCGSTLTPSTAEKRFRLLRHHVQNTDGDIVGQSFRGESAALYQPKLQSETVLGITVK